jgi:hypothetical protein
MCSLLSSASHKNIWRLYNCLYYTNLALTWHRVRTPVIEQTQCRRVLKMKYLVLPDWSYSVSTHTADDITYLSVVRAQLRLTIHSRHSATAWRSCLHEHALTQRQFSVRACSFCTNRNYLPHPTHPNNLSAGPFFPTLKYNFLLSKFHTLLVLIVWNQFKYQRVVMSIWGKTEPHIMTVELSVSALDVPSTQTGSCHSW